MDVDGKRPSPDKGAHQEQETPLKGGASLNKGAHQEQVSGGDEEPDSGGEGPKEEGLSKGEDEVGDMDDEAVTPSVAPTRCGMQVTKKYQQEFPMMGGKWVGKGAIWKAAEIRVNVSGLKLSKGQANWRTSGDGGVPHCHEQALC